MIDLIFELNVIAINDVDIKDFFYNRHFGWLDSSQLTQLSLSNDEAIIDGKFYGHTRSRIEVSAKSPVLSTDGSGEIKAKYTWNEIDAILPNEGTSVEDALEWISLVKLDSKLINPSYVSDGYTNNYNPEFEYTAARIKHHQWRGLLSSKEVYEYIKEIKPVAIQIIGYTHSPQPIQRNKDGLAVETHYYSKKTTERSTNKLNSSKLNVKSR